ncbi:MAG TPA: isochorismatase family cysteine hydrolase [Acetobacteraceae bacterium]|nr:isochorismatase family cysteine hydrolase [Acetobacteraceae bacterium]
MWRAWSRHWRWWRRCRGSARGFCDRGAEPPRFVNRGWRRRAWRGLRGRGEHRPEGDEVVIPKTSSSVFISTNIHCVLGNLGVRYLIVTGVLTDQCIDSAVRDACDLGYLVSLVTDACASLSKARQESALANNRGYCRQVTTEAMREELARLG